MQPGTENEFAALLGCNLSLSSPISALPSPKVCLLFLLFTFFSSVGPCSDGERAAFQVLKWFTGIPPAAAVRVCRGWRSGKLLIHSFLCLLIVRGLELLTLQIQWDLAAILQRTFLQAINQCTSLDVSCYQMKKKHMPYYRHVHAPRE